MKLLRLWYLFLLAIAVTLTVQPANAHPMGNFSINHYARFEAKQNGLALRYILDFAEIPTADRMPQLDSNADGTVSGLEKSAYLKSQAATFLNGLSLRIDSKRVALIPQKADLETLAGAGGLPTLRIWVDSHIALPNQEQIHVDYRDSNFEGRTGWMEVIAVAGKQRRLGGSDASTIDQSRGLTLFPIDAGIVPPRQNTASFSVFASDGGESNASVPAMSANHQVTNDQTPHNRFTQSIAEHDLTPGLVLWGLLFAFAFGAIHALSPGHGKTMVAAYLVGSRGTPRHAVLLGLVVTLTHTFGVFALGFALLFASRYIVPERLFPALSALSGLIIFGVGLWLLMSRWQGLSAVHLHDGHAHDGHSPAHHSHLHDDNHAHESPAHEGLHAHSQGKHSHSQHTHSHGGQVHSHAVPDGPVTMKTLVALGISGGIVPCPEALIVLLAAIKLHRIGYGMVLITAFSVGLAAALIAIGMLVVSARHHLSRFDKLGEGSVLMRYLPIGSAAAITLIGAVLTLKAAVGAP